jgi:hypothetical protein
MPIQRSLQINFAHSFACRGIAITLSAHGVAARDRIEAQLEIPLPGGLDVRIANRAIGRRPGPRFVESDSHQPQPGNQAGHRGLLGPRDNVHQRAIHRAPLSAEGVRYNRL